MKTRNRYRKSAALLAAAMLLSFPLAAGASAQSLWSDNGGVRSVFADRKACQVGDILTIVISETTSTTAAKSNSNSKKGSTTLNAGIGIFDFLRAASAGASDSFSASGAAKDTSSFKGNVTVTVVDVQPNGNMTLEGTQSIWQNRDEHRITFRGVCRMDDVTAANTIPSTKIADATVRFDGKGPLNAKQRQGILTQVFNFLF